jgi:alpha-2-macroglobulin
MRTHIKSALCALVVALQSFGPLSFAANAQLRRPSQVKETKTGLQIILSEGAAATEKAQPSVVAAAIKLSENESEQVLKRLRPIKTEPADEQDFNLRDRSLPAPRAGHTVAAAFPPAEKRDAPDRATTGPLEVVRYSPEGDVPLAPQLSVTFSQPMIAVTSHKDALSESVPVRLTPRPSGKWRWVGTKTLLFEPEGRFPMATAYIAEVPAGTKSASGAVFAASKSWKFVTPPPQVKRFYPEGEPTTRNPLLFVEFDQRVNAAAVADTIRLQSGGREWRVRPATAEEVEANETVRKLASNAMKDRWFAFRVVDPANSGTPLPAASPINVAIGPGTPSAEGPLKTTAAQNYSFHTYGPLTVTSHRCGWRGECSPYDDWQINFSNPIDFDVFETSQVRIEEIGKVGQEPEPVSLNVTLYGNSLSISGMKRGRASYRVTLDPAIRDQFGQTLGPSRPVVFNVGPSPAGLAPAQKNFVVLDPSAPPRYSVYSINHDRLKLRLYRAAPQHWAAFLNYQRLFNEGKPAQPPGELVVSKTIDVKARPDEMAETRIDLATALKDGFGQVIIIVEPVVTTNRRGRNTVIAWAQATQIGLDAFVDNSELVGWATSLKDGRPVDAAEISIETTRAAGSRSEASATTGPDGISRISFISDPGRASKVLVARKGRDVAMLPENTGYWNANSSWVKLNQKDALRWFVFDDRKMYRPGEEVHVKGWVRRIGSGKTGDVGSIDTASSNVTYTLRDSRGNEVLKGAARMNALGGFDAAFKLPATMNLGGANLQLQLLPVAEVVGQEHHHSFQVQEFRRPEFEVTAQATEGPHFVGASATATVSASYYAGGGLANTEVDWRVTSSPARFTPPNRDDYIFGKWVPWWIAHYDYREQKVETFKGRTDAAGKHTLKMDFAAANPPQPSTVKAEASVTDVNRQAWTAAANMLVHPADLYVGIRSPRTFVQKGEPLIIQSIVTDLDGKIITGREIKMRAVLMDWVYEKGNWQQKEKNPQDCAVKSAGDAVECRFETKEGGEYRVRATVEDSRGRKNESEMTLWVAGGKVIPRRAVEQEKAELIPDRKEYRDGETAEILVQSPFFPAEGVLTLRRSGIVTVERFKMETASHTLRIPIKESYTPNIHAQVDLVGATARTDDAGKPIARAPMRPAFASGSLNLAVPPLARKLAVEAKPRDKAIEPGGETTVDVEVRDAEGKPVSGSELAVVVVDESVLSLTNYRVGDPVSTFYAHRGDDVRDHHLRASVLLGNPEDVIAQSKNLPVNGRNFGFIAEAGRAMDAVMPAPPPANMPQAAKRALAEVSAGQDSELIKLRENFNALAVFAPAVPTDASGRASVKVKLPDNLTRYRVMAVAVAGGKQFGGGEATITARLPLMARPSAPRFLNFGDRVELPVVVQNQTDSAMDVSVAVRATNAELTEGAGRRVTVPANDRVEVRFPVSAARAGTARFQIAAVSAKSADAAEIELPVWTPATTEAFATYGEIDQGAIVQPVKAPTDVVKQFGGLEVTTSSTELQSLTDAVLYLVSYPFECSEQLASRVMGVASLRDVLAAFKAKGLPEPKELIEAVARDVKRLEGLQNDDGGFGFWRRNDESWPYVSIHVPHALHRAKAKGFDVPAQMMDRSKKYLREIEQHIPRYYGAEARRALVAYALYVRNLMGDKDAAKARRLIAEAGLTGLPLEATGWLLAVFSNDAGSQSEVASLRKHLSNRATEEAATAHFVTSYRESDHLLLNSSRRADAVILEALIKDQPSNDLIPKIVRGLLGHRKQGRWENTQENAFVLVALDRYFATYEKITPDFVARAWLGDAYAGGHEFRGRTTERHSVSVPMRVLTGGGQQNLILSKEGAGRMYYRVGMQYAPASLRLEAAEHGFTVERVYEAIDNAEDVRRDAQGAWRIKAGARVRVKLTMAAPSRRYHVALVDPIPAGLEALNPALAVTGSIPKDLDSEEAKRGWWWARPWFEHQNMRDERVEAFASLLWEGVYTYSYVARATTPGVFVVPPPKAEEMYHPETFGRGASDRVIVE